MSLFPPEVLTRYHADGSWGDQTIYDLFKAAAQASPQRAAVIDAPNRSAFAQGVPARLSYRTLLHLVDRLAACLWMSGLRPGDILLVQMPNIHELLALYLAAARVGIVMSPVPLQYRHAELQAIVDIVEPRAFCTVSVWGRLHPATHFLAGVRFTGSVLAFGEASLDSVRNLSTELQAANLNDLSVLSAIPPVSADQLFSICWTSGTEGKPKGVPKTHNNWLCSSQHAVRAGWMPAGGTVLAPFPLVNAAGIGGLLMSWLGAAGTLVLHHPFDIDVFLSQISSERVAYTIAAPALLSSIADKLEQRPRDYDLTSLKAIGCGSAPVDPSLVARLEALLPLQIINLFGSNEGIQLCADRQTVPDPSLRARLFPRNGDDLWRPQSRTANFGRVRLVDPESGERISERNRIGELRIAGPSLFPGYFSRGALDRSQFDQDGFFRTGDLFDITDGLQTESAFRFIGRRKELIVRGGMKIAPAELDALIGSHPLVLEGAVAAWPDSRLGERVCAFVVPRVGATLTLSALCDWLDVAGLARFKWPERLMILEALPRNALAKVQRAELTDLIQADSEQAG